MRFTEQQHAAMVEWLTLHQVDPNIVPLDGPIDFDRDANEWRITVYRLRDGRKYIDPDTREPAMGVIRRRWRAWCPLVPRVPDLATLTPPEYGTGLHYPTCLGSCTGCLPPVGEPS